jgi:hypothetical protein
MSSNKNIEWVIKEAKAEKFREVAENLARAFLETTANKDTIADAFTKARLEIRTSGIKDPEALLREKI